MNLNNVPATLVRLQIASYYKKESLVATGNKKDLWVHQSTASINPQLDTT